MKLIVIESPFAGEVERNLLYLDYAIRDAIERGESPYASHRMLTSALDDTDAAQRAIGIEAGLAWRMRADDRVFYIDLGWSKGMEAAVHRYDGEGYSYTVRKLGINERAAFDIEAARL